MQIFRFKMERKVLAHPCVVEAVTLTTIIVALVRICCSVSLFLHFSRLFPNSWEIMNRAQSGSYHNNWVVIWFKRKEKRKVNNTWSHLDCPDVIKRIWDQRFKLWEPFGVFVSCKFMNNIWNQTVAIKIFNAGGRNVSENAFKTHWAHCRSLLWDYWLLQWVCTLGQPQLDHRLRENKNCLVKLDNPWPSLK